MTFSVKANFEIAVIVKLKSDFPLPRTTNYTWRGTWELSSISRTDGRIREYDLTRRLK